MNEAGDPTGKDKNTTLTMPVQKCRLPGICTMTLQESLELSPNGQLQTRAANSTGRQIDSSEGPDAVSSAVGVTPLSQHRCGMSLRSGTQKRSIEALREGDFLHQLVRYPKRKRKEDDRPNTLPSLKEVLTNLDISLQR